MEIVTIILSGEITHTDSMGNEHSLKAGEVQRMSAGTGITHSEFNRSTEPLHLYQIWIIPDTPGLTPSYEEKTFDLAARTNNLLPLVSGEGIDGTLNIHSASTIFVSTLEAENGLTYEADPGRAIFFYLTSGAVELNGERLEKNDQARLMSESKAELAINAKEESSFVLIDLPVRD
jgi:redox-sensitive bicupin YhaK (pirin superfamily)